VGVIAALLTHPIHLERLRVAVREHHTIIPCTAWGEVIQACDEQAVHLAVMDLAAIGAPNFDPVRQLKLRHPNVALIAYLTVSLDKVHDVFDAGRYGFDGLVIADRDDGPSTLFAAVERAGARSASTAVRRAIGDVHPVARDAILIAVSRAHERLTPVGLARIIGIHPRQVARILQEANFPPPGRLITWGRLIVAAQLLGDTKRSADRIASVLAFPSGSAFRNTCRRYLGKTPHEIRAAGGARFVLEAMMNEIRTGGPKEA
jgi:AraC-like DNA-binding protein